MFADLQAQPNKTMAAIAQLQDLNTLLGDRGGFLGQPLAELKVAAARFGANIDGMAEDQAAITLEHPHAEGKFLRIAGLAVIVVPRRAGFRSSRFLLLHHCLQALQVSRV